MMSGPPKRPTLESQWIGHGYAALLIDLIE